MFDVLLIPLFARALFLSTRRRFLAGLILTAVATCLWALLLAAGWYGRGADATGSFMVLIFVGPSATPGSIASVPLSALLAVHPIAAKVVLSTLFAVAFALAWRAALRFSPLSDEAAMRKHLGLVYLMPSLLLFAQVVCLELNELLAAHL